MRSISSALAFAVVAAGTVGCATPTLVRGAAAPAIHGEVKRILEAEGYACKPSPDRSWDDCVHPDLFDISYGYLPRSNMLQLWTTIGRLDDEGLVPKWRAPGCAGVAEDVASINDQSIIKIICTPDSVRFEQVTWVPDHGFTDDDVHGIADIFRAVIGETIRDRGFLLKDQAADSGAAPADAAAAPAETPAEL